LNHDAINNKVYAVWRILSEDISQKRLFDGLVRSIKSFIVEIFFHEGRGVPLLLKGKKQFYLLTAVVAYFPDFNKEKLKPEESELFTDYKHRGPGFDSRALLRIFLRELGLERGPLSLVIG
jgi:hypothetical protein